MYKYVIIGIVVLIIFFILTETFFKGFIGETMISINLKKLIKKQGFVINNLIIEENDKSNQMDHILISKKAPEKCPVCNHPKGYFQLFNEAF